MKTLSEADLVRAARVFLVANTPTYLYKHLRQDPAVLCLQETHSTSELTQLLSDYAGEGAGRDEAPVAICVCLVALSFKPLPEYRDFLMAFDSPDVRWLPELKGRILAEQESVKRIIINPSAVPARQTITHISSATQRVETTIKPKIIIPGEGMR